MWDVLVIGGGPAGASAACFLAGFGSKVLVADREAFPRDKTCGDGVSVGGLAVLNRLGLSGWLTDRQFLAPQTLLLSAPNGDSVQLGFGAEPVVYGRVIPRRELDQAVLNRAIEAGAQLAERFTVRHLERTAPDVIEVRGVCAGRERTERARVAIVAEGAHGTLARAEGLVREPPDLVAVRGYFDGAAPPDDRLEIHYERTISPGYAWLFPLGNGRVNVGMGSFTGQVRSQPTTLPSAFRRIVGENRYLRERLAGSWSVGPVRGCPLRTGVYRARQVADNLLLAGEIAHLVNPLTGEGIAAALESGEMAAQHVLAALQSGRFDANGLRPYERALRRRYGADHRAAVFIRAALAHGSVVNRLVRGARDDQVFGLKVGLAIIGATGPRELLRPGLLARFLA